MQFRIKLLENNFELFQSALLFATPPITMAGLPTRSSSTGTSPRSWPVSPKFASPSAPVWGFLLKSASKLSQTIASASSSKSLASSPSTARSTCPKEAASSRVARPSKAFKRPRSQATSGPTWKSLSWSTWSVALLKTSLSKLLSPSPSLTLRGPSLPRSR